MSLTYQRGPPDHRICPACGTIGAPTGRRSGTELRYSEEWRCAQAGCATREDVAALPVPALDGEGRQGVPPRRRGASTPTTWWTEYDATLYH